MFAIKCDGSQVFPNHTGFVWTLAKGSCKSYDLRKSTFDQYNKVRIFY